MIIEFRDVVLFEDIFPYKRKEDKTSGKRTHEMAFRDESLRNQLIMRKLNQEEVRDLESQNLFVQIFIAYAIESDPQIFKEAMSTPKAQIWKEAINSEIESILRNHTWELANLSPSSKPIGSK